MSERYSEITIATPIHGMSGMSSDCFVASDGYVMLRSADRLDVLIHNERTLAQCIVPWAQVRKAVPADVQCIKLAQELMQELSADDEEPITSVETPEAAKRRGGWPKGKPRKETAP